MGPRKYLVGTHANSLVIDPRTQSPVLTRIRAKEGCKRCYGRGFTGWYATTGGQAQTNVCRCFAKAIMKYTEEHGIKPATIKVDLVVDPEESNSKIYGGK